MNPDFFDRQLAEYLWTMLLRMPIFLVALGGMVWAMERRSKAPRASLAAILGCGLLILLNCTLPLAHSAAVYVVFVRGAAPAEMLTLVHRVIVVSGNLCMSVALGVLLFAIFTGRSYPPTDDPSRSGPPM